MTTIASDSINHEPTARNLRVGIEIELLAPPGVTRQDLATGIAAAFHGSANTTWHLDSEMVASDERAFYHHLMPAFDVVDETGAPVARLVDDITLRSDLDPTQQSAPGWRRIVSDDPRILRMLATAIDPIAVQHPDLRSEVEHVAKQFGLIAEPQAGASKLSDSSGAQVAMLAPLPAGRERICELVSAPLLDEFEPWIISVLEVVRELGFTIPTEATMHVHYDASLFRSLAACQRLVWAFSDNLTEIRRAFDTNPNARRLGALPPQLTAVLENLPHDAGWLQVVSALRSVPGITKYADVNLTRLLEPAEPTHESAILSGDTVEFRFLPSSTDPYEVLDLVRRLDESVEHLSHVRF